MAVYAILAGLVLSGIGGWGYLGADGASPSITTLIPAFVGVPLILLGLLALKDGFRKHAMHRAAMVGVIGALLAPVGLFMGYRRASEHGKTVGEWLQGRGTMASGGMLLVCVIFVALCVKSFIDVRRARKAAGGA
jgi:uncharacterized membrane protein